MDTIVHAAVEIAGASAGAAENALRSVRVLSGLEAFRDYNWIQNIRVVNSAGDFRGMVVSSRWAAVFQFSDKAVPIAEKVGAYATIAGNVLQSASRIQAILSSKDDPNIKAARLSTEVSSVCLRSAVEIPASPVIAIDWALRNSLGFAQSHGLRSAGDWNRALQALNTAVGTRFESITDGNNIYLVVQKYFGRP